MASVASFFVSRIDVAVDKLIEERLEQAPAGNARSWRQLRGKVAIANAKLAYQRYKRLFAGPRWETLTSQGRPDAAPALGQHRRPRTRPTATFSMSRS